MCGIFGICSLDGSAVDPRPLVHMGAVLRHRGPDSDGRLVDGPVALGMRRLSIIDIAGGEQPLANEDGSVKAFQNGEIYNHRELRAELERSGHRLATRSDTEVLAHLAEDGGLAFLERLRGMFAIAVWDARRRRLLLARDRYGIKPLYYRLDGASLSFASELGALPPGEVDPEALEAYLAFNSIPAPHTIYREVRKLGAGEALVVEPGGARPRVVRWCRPRPPAAGGVRREPDGELAAELRGRLRESVRAHLVADVPVGVLLSGGVDSAALAALASEAADAPVATFSVGFEERAANELDRARLVARRYGTDHHEIVVRPDAARLLPEVVAAFDEPFADSSALPTYLVSRLAAGHVKVALSGEGGDELFGGYHTYVADLLAARLGGIARRANPLVERLPSGSAPVSLDYKLKRFTRAADLPPLERHHGWKEIFSPELRAELLLGPRVSGFDPVDVLRRRYAETTGADELARLQDVDLGVYLVDDLLVKTDRASMAHSLEARVPFLDPAVADFALALPRPLKVRGFSKKRLLRRALGPLVPAEILGGRKRGFSIPAAAWLRGELEPFAREVLAPAALRRQGYLDPGRVARLLDEHAARRADHSRQLWGLLCLTLWHDEARARRTASAA